MALRKPESMDECFYFTNRTIDSGKVTAWAFKKQCPQCNEELMGKPIKKNGKVDKKAEYYECPKCKYQENEEEYAKSIVLSIEYTCPHCGKSGEATTEYKRMPYKGTKAYIFVCNDCGEKIGITKKLKNIKPKKPK